MDAKNGHQEKCRAQCGAKVLGTGAQFGAQGANDVAEQDAVNLGRRHASGDN